MKGRKVLIIRAATAVLLALLLTRIFYPGTPPAAALGLAVVLVGLAYLFDYLRGRKPDA